MKILFFTPYFYPYTSGITTIPLKIFSHFSKNHTITVLTFPHKKNLPTEELLNGFTIIRMPYLFKVSKGYISPQSLYYFFREIRKNDVILLNIPNVEGVFLACLAFFMRKKIISIFNCLVKLPTHFFNKFIELILTSCIWIQIKLSSTVITYTKDYLTSTWLNQIYNANPELFAYILPPIELLPVHMNYLKELQKQKKDTIWIGFAGRIASEKGIEFLIKALNTIQFNTTNRNVHLVIAGPEDTAGEHHYSNEIKKQLNNASFSYTFLGKLSDEDFGAFFSSIDILVLPSINSTEAFGMVQVEAMLLGTPVVTTNLPGVRIPITLTKMGEIVEPKDSEGLSKAITTIIQNYSLYTNDKLIKNAQDIFSIKKTIHSFEQSIIKN